MFAAFSAERRQQLGGGGDGGGVEGLRSSGRDMGRSRVWGFVLTTHLATSASASLFASHGGCAVSLPALFACVVGTVTAAKFIFSGHTSGPLVF
jgi:hypothetical protein